MMPRHIVERIAKSVDGTDAVIFTIDDLLDRAHDHFRALLRGSENLAADLGILEEERPSIFIPPQDQPICDGERDGTWENERFSPRVERLIERLQRIGVFTDDLIIRRGATDPNSMRKTSYLLIEIPRLGREVLVCNQVGEATRHSRLPLGAATYERSNKSDLDQIPGVRRITCNNMSQWEGYVMNEITRGTDVPSVKIDVRLLEQLRREMRTVITSEEWLQCTSQDLHNLRLPSGGFIELSRNIYGNDINWTRETILQWGIKIFGFGDPHISHAVADLHHSPRYRHIPFDPNDRWRENLLHAFPTAETWLRLLTESPTNKEMARQWLYSLGFPMNIMDKRPTEFIAVGKRLYGEEDTRLKTVGDELRNTCPPYGASINVEEIISALDRIESLQNRGLHSLAVVLKLKRKTEYFQQELSGALLLAEEVKQELSKQTNFPPLDEKAASYYAFSALSVSACHLREHLKWCLNEPARLSYELPRIEQIAQNFGNQMQRLSRLEAHSRNILETIDSRGTPLTSMITRSELRLTNVEGIMLQMILNEGEWNSCTFNNLRHVLDPISEEGEDPPKGTLRAIAMSLNRKLFRNRLGGIVISNDNNGYAYYSVGHAGNQPV